MPYDYTPNVPQTFQTWTPILLGATDNPTVTYTKQYGRYWVRDSKFCKFTFIIITSSITKTTLTDAVLVQLPFSAANPDSDYVQQNIATLYNSTLVKSGNFGEIAPGTNYLKITQNNVNTPTLDITYAVTSIGSLLGTITVRANGVYEIA